MASRVLKESDLTLNLNEPLGEGGFGIVYRANLKGIDQPVAAKKLKAVNIDINENVEVSLLQQVHHFNILKFFGAFIAKDKHVILVTELAENGSLRDYLSKATERLPGGLFFKWSLHGACAVQYLQRVKVVHRDIKSPNFLIDKEDVLKLCDFGLAKILERTEDVTSERGSTRWMAPECFKDFKLSPKSDIFALGVVIWELITREIPYSDLQVEQSVIWAVGNDNRRPEIPADVSPGLRNLIERCWDADRTKRPHIDEVVHILETEWLKRSGSLRRQTQGAVPYKEAEETLNMKLFTAVLAGDKEYCQLLVDNGARIESTGKFGSSPLHAAAVSQQVELCQYLIQAGSNIEMVEATDEDNWTPLFTAARTGQDKICKLFIDVGARVNRTTDEHMTPLYIAAQYGHVDSCEVLLDAGANIEARFQDQFTPLRIASSYGHDKTCQLLIKRGANLLTKDKIGNTSLHIACSLGYADVVMALLYNDANHKLDVNARGQRGRTPLMNAAEVGSILICHCLLGLNADHTAKMEDTGCQALHLAAQNGHTDICQLLIDDGAEVMASGKANWRNTPLHLAAKNGHEKTCQLLLAWDSNVNAQNKQNATPLHLAAIGNHVKVCETLLQYKADPKMKTEDNISTLRHAARQGNAEVCKVLLEHGVGDDEEGSSEKQGAFHTAAYRGHDNVCQVLLEAGVDVNSATDEGWTSLHETAQCGYDEVCMVLLKANAKVNVVTKEENKTPLYVAAENGHVGVCFQLVQAGADVHAADHEQRTPLFRAAQNGNDLICNTLIIKEADVNATMHDQSTPLHFAAENGHMSTCQILVEAGGNARSKNKNDQTPIDLAEENGHDEISEFLEEAQPKKVDRAKGILLQAVALGLQGVVDELPELLKKMEDD